MHQNKCLATSFRRARKQKIIIANSYIANSLSKDLILKILMVDWIMVLYELITCISTDDDENDTTNEK